MYMCCCKHCQGVLMPERQRSLKASLKAFIMARCPRIWLNYNWSNAPTTALVWGRGILSAGTCVILRSYGSAPSMVQVNL